ncbi:MAG: [FeFe] hydrogenase H-cluster radical SAM maturase HydG [Ignavibacteria bacterium GWB2_35_12]|nr:MAG: [FeFe] hydrogenase H-cluster radical SAM maturase HydG [Ignavibacteria bacterium GWB2_35_12]OGU95453.1 MAG: [FeFe] hydrogenase H-cluster radical SAM maturase HydG [Ignavibacteria bacterium RIFOXYA2_FULL_35_10]OGV20831.1 MAG: [FeFe] hydrogenase H-cluster radical SAM maturase HydG [Ignavibacteria bacterium RIFOXYC2_FULL_35_21]
MSENINFIDESFIEGLITETQNPPAPKIDEILNKALQLQGLDLLDAAYLLNIKSGDLLNKLLHTAYQVKQEIYGNRLVLFAPLYISNFCSNNCLYCGFRVDNKDIVRRVLSLDEIKDETLSLLEQGHKRILMLMGEHHKNCPFDYFLEAINAAYSVKDKKCSSIRRINVEIAPLDENEFQKLSKVHIGTYTVFQETYHRETYSKMHPGGIKSDYNWRLSTMDRALSNGMHDVGIGALFGLYDYRFEVLSLIQHAKHLDKKFNVGPHTISIPRIKPAKNAPASFNLEHAVSDEEFKKLIAVIRCSVPYTGMILSTREPAELRSELFNYGISQISAGSRTSPGGYKQAFSETEEAGQFSLNDCRTSGEVIRDVIQHGFVPSFCTACYRLGRVGEDFMDKAKPGLIKLFCQPNALTTLKEYLVDYADPETKQLGEELIQKELATIPNDKVREKTGQNLIRIQQGERDLYL